MNFPTPSGHSLQVACDKNRLTVAWLALDGVDHGLGLVSEVSTTLEQLITLVK